MTSKRKNPCTNWFPGSVKPVWVVVYKRLYPHEAVVFSHWNGEYWGAPSVTINDVEEGARSCFQNFAWLGLANNPNEVTK